MKQRMKITKGGQVSIPAPIRHRWGTSTVTLEDLGDRIVLAAAREFAHLKITANVINPGATDTGWMTEELQAHIGEMTPLARVGRPDDCARLVAFLCSEAGGWINGQLLYSNGGQQ